MMEEKQEQLRGLIFEKLRELCTEKRIKVHGKSKEEMVEALSKVEDLRLGDIIPTVTAGGGTGDVQVLTGQLMEMMLQMQREQRQWIEMQQEKQQRWMELQEKRHVATTDHKMKLPRPTLQKLTADDDIESYLHMFEQVAVQQKWPKDAWATQLAGLLMGDALDAFTSVPTAESSKYEVMKAAILCHFEVNAETYRQRFRKDAKKPGESFKGFLGRPTDKLMLWSNASGLSLKEMVLLEQFLESLPLEMRVRVMERKSSTAGAAAEIVDDLDAARRYEGDGRPAAAATSRSRQTRSASPTLSAVRPFRVPPWPKTNTRGEIQCWACEGWGHIAANCPDKNKSAYKEIKSAGKVYSGNVSISQPHGVNALCFELLYGSELLHSLIDCGIVKEGTFDDKAVKILLDTGNQTSAARVDLVSGT